MYKLYHATPYSNLSNILDSGIKLGHDGLIYMCEQPIDSVKFLAVRGIKDILVVEVKVPKRLEDTIIETFDHSESFFKCRAFASTEPIGTERLGKFIRYQI